MAAWQQLVKVAEENRNASSRLWCEADAMRCPFVLAQYGKPMSLGFPDNQHRCVRDKHDGDDHELPGTSWVEKSA